MTVSTTGQLDTLATTLKDGAGQLADLLKQQAALKTKLENAAKEADLGGWGFFGDVFRDMAARLGSLPTQNGKPALPVARRRGRPAKLADGESSDV